MAQDKDLKKFQQAANRIQNHPKWEEALEELDTTPTARSEAKGNAKGYFKGKGVPVPDEMEVTFREGSTIIQLCGWGVCITIQW
jgi:hypothetical protein